MGYKIYKKKIANIIILILEIVKQKIKQTSIFLNKNKTFNIKNKTTKMVTCGLVAL